MRRARDGLIKLAGRPRMVRVRRRFPGEVLHNGFVLGLARDLVLFQQFHDFYLEGYTALRVDDIKGVRSGPHERFWERMFRGERLMERVGIAYAVRLDDFAALLTDLRGRGRMVIVECESLESDEEDEFCMGRIVAIENDSVKLLCVDSLGVWDDEPWVVYFRNITKVQFDTPYIHMYEKYAEKPPC